MASAPATYSVGQRLYMIPTVASRSTTLKSTHSSGRDICTDVVTQSADRRQSSLCQWERNAPLVRRPAEAPARVENRAPRCANRRWKRCSGAYCFPIKISCRSATRGESLRSDAASRTSRAHHSGPGPPSPHRRHCGPVLRKWPRSIHVPWRDTHSPQRE